MPLANLDYFLTPILLATAIIFLTLALSFDVRGRRFLMAGVDIALLVVVSTVSLEILGKA